MNDKKTTLLTKFILKFVSLSPEHLLGTLSVWTIVFISEKIPFEKFPDLK